jgi:RNA polymerase sigma factor (sigma-70 family)
MTSVISRTRARTSGLELREMVQLAGAGDRRAWKRLVEEFSGMVWAIARAHRLSSADAADVSQCAWLRLFEHLDSIREPERVGAWLATTARRECLRVLRVADRHVLSGDELGTSDCTDSALEQILTAERDGQLWRSFSRLRRSDQVLLRLLTAEPRLAYEEISAALGMPIGSIGPTRARALERLRQELDREGGLALPSAV